VEQDHARGLVEIGLSNLAMPCGYSAAPLRHPKGQWTEAADQIAHQ
jgi:hypothetical protein